MLKALNARLIARKVKSGDFSAEAGKALIQLNCPSKMAHAVVAYADAKSCTIEQAYRAILESNGSAMRIVGAFGLIGAAVRLAATVLLAVFGGALEALGAMLIAAVAANPFIALVVAAVALGVAIGLLVANVGGLRDKLAELVVNGISGAWRWLVDTFVGVATALGTHIAEIAAALARDVTTGVSGAWQWLVDAFDNVVTSIKDKFKAAVDFIRNLGSQIGSFFGLGSGAGAGQSGSSGDDGSSSGRFAFAGGGAVSGPGSGTSDSILARLSNGEFVQRAAAVKHYGLSFMHAINTLRFPVPQFALGGLVDRIAIPSPAALLPRFADGGLVGRLAPAGASGGLHPVTLQMPDGRKVSGLFAKPDAVDEFRKASFMQQISATGKRSSSVG